MANPKSIAVIGAREAGRGIVQLAALAGFRVVLEDLVPGSLRRAEGEVSDNFNEAVAQGLLTEAEARAALSCIEYGTSLEGAARDAEIVIEAAPEELESKEEILRLLDRFCRPDAFMVTISAENTVTELGEFVYRPERLVGMRFGNPVNKSTSIEVVRGAKSSDEAVAVVTSVAEALAKEVIATDEAQTAQTARTT